jgi:hypothetical protein
VAYVKLGRQVHGGHQLTFDKAVSVVAYCLHPKFLLARRFPSSFSSQSDMSETIETVENTYAYNQKGPVKHVSDTNLLHIRIA